jgi:hypothetical protein
MGPRRACLLSLVAVVAAGGLLAPARAPGSASPLVFEPVQELPPLGSYPMTVAIADVTGDRRKDVLMSTSAYQNQRYDWKVLLYRQLPNGTLAPPEAFSPVWKVAAQGLAVGDVDGDDLNDVVLATDLGVNVFRQRGGTLSRPFLVPRTVGGYSADVADMNLDGRKDIVVRGWNWVRIARNTRRGFRTTVVTRGREQDVEVGDVTGDRRPDLVTASFQGKLRVYRQRRTGSFARPRVQRTERGASAVKVIDFTRDGRLDVALANGGSLEVLVQDAKGRLASSAVTPGIDFPRGIEALDMSGDGRVDLIARASESVAVVLQEAQGSREGFDLYHAYRPLSWQPNAIAAGDVTGDGRPDIVAAGGLARGLFLWRQLPRG